MQNVNKISEERAKNLFDSVELSKFDVGTINGAIMKSRSKAR
jgi:hypothetical protein